MNYNQGWIVLIIILLLAFWFKDDIVDKLNLNKRKKNTNKKNRKKTQNTDTNESNIELPNKLYNLLHAKMKRDIQLDEFKKISGLDSIIFTELKQLYTNRHEEGYDLDSITVDDYYLILNN